MMLIYSYLQNIRLESLLVVIQPHYKENLNFYLVPLEILKFMMVYHNYILLQQRVILLHYYY